MVKRLFLEGKPQSGKTSLIISALGEKIKKSGGFGTLRLHSEDGKIRGYCHVPAKNLVFADIDYFPDARMFIEVKNERAELNPAVLKYTEDLLLRAQGKNFAVLDEIGGFELSIPGFKNALYGVFEAGVPCVGVLKSPPEKSDYFKRAGLSEDYIEQYNQLWDYLSTDPETEIFHFEHGNGALAEEKIALWLKENQIDNEE